MKKLFYLLLIVFTACSLQSCNEKDDQEDEFTNLYGKYEKPHFVFEYATDTIRIQMMETQKKIAVDDFKQMFTAMATEKMSAYFKGIHFKENRQLLISAQAKDSTAFHIPATYELSGKHFEVTLDKDVMNHLLGNSAALIPPISFSYYVAGNQMTLYFDKLYISVIYSMMEDRIASMIVEMMNIDFSHMPEGTETKIINKVKTQLLNILEQIQKVEIGFVLNLDEYDY